MAQPPGPRSISLYSAGVAEPMRMLNNYLRRENNLLGKQVTELAILTAAREFDSNYIWSAHEPTALKVGVPQATIDVIKFRKDASGVAGKEGLVINVGRQTGFGDLRQGDGGVRQAGNGRTGGDHGRLFGKRSVPARV